MAGQSTREAPAGVAERAGPGPAERGPPGPGAADRALQVLRRSGRPAALRVLLFVAWWAVPATGLVQPYLVASPGDTFAVIADKSGYFWQNTLVTLWETLAGFVLAIVVGVLAAVLMEI